MYDQYDNSKPTLRQDQPVALESNDLATTPIQQMWIWESILHLGHLGSSIDSTSINCPSQEIPKDQLGYTRASNCSAINVFHPYIATHPWDNLYQFKLSKPPVKVLVKLLHFLKTNILLEGTMLQSLEFLNLQVALMMREKENGTFMNLALLIGPVRMECHTFQVSYWRIISLRAGILGPPLLSLDVLPIILTTVLLNDTGSTCTKRMEKVNLPPETCVLHAGIKGNLWRGAVRLPSVLHHFERALLAADLRDLIGIPISCFKVLEALTSGACDMQCSYEQLEILGDSFLKFTGSIHLYVENPELGKECLGMLLFNLVCDKRLFHYALNCNLQVYVFAESVSIKEWTPPGYEQITDGDQPSETSLKMQKVSYRTLADVVEALIATYLLNGNMNLALKAMQWLEFPFHFPVKWGEVHNCGLTVSINMTEKVNIEQLEAKLGYHFENNCLFALALHCDQDKIVFERMDFLGDAIICFIVTHHLTVSYPSLNVGKINDIRQAIVSIENLACVVIRHNLHEIVKQVSSLPEQDIIEFLKYLQRGHFEMEELDAYCKARRTALKVKCFDSDCCCEPMSYVVTTSSRKYTKLCLASRLALYF
eukprot:Gb_37867 [translate_table: standard]